LARGLCAPLHICLSLCLTVPVSVCLRRWRAYFTSGSSALYLFLYSLFYFYTKLDITKTVPMMMYFGYMFIVSYSFFCLTGTIGFYACYLFVRKIYSAVKID
jgi:transmembrane 9 superfamily member 2/4